MRIIADEAKREKFCRNMGETARATAELLLQRVGKSAGAQEMLEAINDMGQGALSVALGSMIPIPVPILASATADPMDGEEYHLLVYANVKASPNAVLEALCAVLNPHLVDCHPAFKFDLREIPFAGAEA